MIERILLDHPGFCVGWRGVLGTVPLRGHRFVTGLDSQRTDAYHQISNVNMGNPDLDSLGFMQQIAFKVVPPQEQGGE